MFGIRSGSSTSACFKNRRITVRFLFSGSDQSFICSSCYIAVFGIWCILINGNGGCLNSSLMFISFDERTPLLPKQPACAFYRLLMAESVLEMIHTEPINVYWTAGMQHLNCVQLPAKGFTYSVTHTHTSLCQMTARGWLQEGIHRQQMLCDHKKKDFCQSHVSNCLP